MDIHNIVDYAEKNPESASAIVGCTVWIIYNILPRTPPANQPWRALWVMAEHVTWTAWDRVSLAYKGAYGPMPRLARHTSLRATDSLRPPVAGAEEVEGVDAYITDPPPAQRGDTLPSVGAP